MSAKSEKEVGGKQEKLTRWRGIGVVVDDPLAALPNDDGPWGDKGTCVPLNIIHSLGEARGIFNGTDEIKVGRD